MTTGIVDVDMPGSVSSLTIAVLTLSAGWPSAASAPLREGRDTRLRWSDPDLDARKGDQVPSSRGSGSSLRRS